MVYKHKFPKEKMTQRTKSGKNLALTIILGIFIAAMFATFFNLVVSYAYPGPEYNKFCNQGDLYPSYPLAKPLGDTSCGFNRTLQEQTQQCIAQEGQPVYAYNDSGCPNSIERCDFCNKEYNDAQERHNRISFYIFALVGFILIAIGLFIPILLLQIAVLPAGAFLVIEAAVRNFDDKLTVIIVFGLLIAAAVYLAIRKLK